MSSVLTSLRNLLVDFNETWHEASVQVKYRGHPPNSYVRRHLISIQVDRLTSRWVNRWRFRCESMPTPTPLNFTYILPYDCPWFARMRNSFTSVDLSTCQLVNHNLRAKSWYIFLRSPPPFVLPYLSPFSSKLYPYT